ncbi:MAG: KilA-N domain-containing protein [Bacteroidota bacterium]
MAKKLHVENQEIRLRKIQDDTYISLTDMVKGHKKGASSAIISNWLRTVDTLEFLREWETHNNPLFNYLEFEMIRNEAGRRSFFISVGEWIDKTQATGVITKAGRYGGTYAHPDIAFDFGAWISPRFRYLLYREFQRLEKEEAMRLNQNWQQSRLLSKIYFGLQNETVRRYIAPKVDKGSNPYASEADVINVALFGQTAKQWRESNPKLAKEGNMRHFSTERENATLSALEAINSYLIVQGASQYARLEVLQRMARYILEVFDQDERLRLMDRT